MRRRVSGTRFSAIAVVALGSLLAGWSSIAAGQRVDLDLGVIDLATLQQMSPSRVFRPIDMIGVRTGADGWGMGGAHVANVEGVESVSWNPAGLGWLKRSDFMGDMKILGSSGSTSGAPDSFSIPRTPRLSVTRYAVNLKSGIRYGMLGAATSRSIAGRHFGGALSYRRYIDTAYPEAILEDLVQSQNAGYPVTLAFDDQEHGGVEAATASVGIEAVPGLLALGMNVNLLSGILRTDEQLIVATGGPQNSVGEIKSGYDYRGHSIDLGLQLRREDLASVGIRYTPGFSLQVRNGTYSVQSVPSGDATSISYVHARIARHDLDVPGLLSAGGCVWFHPKLSAAFEVDQQKWGDSKVTYVQGLPGNPNPKPQASLPLRNVTSWHMGIEGRILKIGQVDLPVRLGYHAGPLSMGSLQPIGSGPATRVGSEDKDIKASAYTFGFGFLAGNVRYDASYEILDYKIQKFYFDIPYDAFLNRYSTLIDVDRRVTAIRLTATLAL